jgi:hypothetical protein
MNAYNFIELRYALSSNISLLLLLLLLLLLYVLSTISYVQVRDKILSD